VSGVILFDETLRQRTVGGNEPFPEFLAGKGIIPGIKVDKGIHDLALWPGEKVTEGWTVCEGGWRNISSSAPVRQMARGHHHRSGIPATPVSMPTHMRSLAIRRFARKPRSFPSSSRRSCSTAITRSNAATRRPKRRSAHCLPRCAPITCRSSTPF